MGFNHKLTQINTNKKKLTEKKRNTKKRIVIYFDNEKTNNFKEK